MVQALFDFDSLVYVLKAACARTATKLKLLGIEHTIPLQPRAEYNLAPKGSIRPSHASAAMLYERALRLTPYTSHPCDQSCHSQSPRQGLVTLCFTSSAS